nr:cytochrome c oxidase caa3 assembly factor (Caa3_CtaG) [uncultured bacterium]
MQPLDADAVALHREEVIRLAIDRERRGIEQRAAAQGTTLPDKMDPVSAAITYGVVIGTWHSPELYELALRQKLWHVVEHVTFFGAALVYWWPLLSASRVVPQLRPGPQMLYLLGSTIVMTPIFAFITFSHDVLYATYEFAPRLFPKFSPTDDQLLAGTGMQLVGVIVSMTTLGIIFFQWFRAGERKPAEPRHHSRGDAVAAESRKQETRK